MLVFTPKLKQHPKSMNAEESYKKLFALMPEASPEADLVAVVEKQINHSRIVRARFHASLHGLFILSAGVAFIPAINSLTASAYQSGFSEYMSLIGSDGLSILGSWKALALSLAESAPILEIGIMLGLALIFANSLRLGVKYISSISAYNRNAFA
jgi:hypothetical protein